MRAFLLVLIGGLVGWLSNLVLGTNMGIWFIANVFSGMCGAFAGMRLSHLGTVWEVPSRRETAMVKSIPWAASGAGTIVLFLNVMW
jgi:uncharacterized membrane protein YeaQ/YmgE (transglycosylase-associated protein family)